jgi:hypothetical protein
MPSTKPRPCTKADPVTEPMRAPRCGHKCGRSVDCKSTLGPSPAPRQHWVFTNLPSPTTRPPHISADGLVRVVGLGLFSFQMLAGAGVLGSPGQRLVRLGMRDDLGEEET